MWRFIGRQLRPFGVAIVALLLVVGGAFAANGLSSRGSDDGLPAATSETGGAAASDAAESPEVSEAPEASETPEATEAPEATDPAESEAPEATEDANGD